MPARGVKATLGAGCGAKGVLVRVRGQVEPKPGSRKAGVVCRRRGHGGAAAGERRRRCSANQVAYGPNVLAQKEARVSRGLTEGLRWTELRRRGVVGEVWAVVAGGARGEGRCRGWSRVQRARGSSGGRGRAGALLGRGPGAAERLNPGGADLCAAEMRCRGHGAAE